MLLTVGMAVKAVAEAVTVVMALAWAKSGSASTHQHAESTATSQTSNQPNKRDDNHLYRCHLGVEERSAPRFDS